MTTPTPANQKSAILQAIHFGTPAYIPMVFHINSSCWNHYPKDALAELMANHPFLFPGFKGLAPDFKPDFADVARKDTPYTDDFGCTWETTEDGITGTVNTHPLADWSAYATYKLPDPEKSMGLHPIDWSVFEAQCRAQKAAGQFVSAGLRHGHTFLQLSDLRGYESLLMDMVDEEPQLDDLIARLEAFNSAQLRHFIEADVDMIGIPEDLGMQVGPMLGPKQFARYIAPSYRHMTKLARDAGKIVHMHSDGDIRLLVDDIIGGGVDVMNLQDLVNGIDWIAKKFRGKTCIDLDIDRQSITPYGTPAQIDALIKSEVEAISCREGGLMMIYGLYPGVPLENVKALMDAMERYAFYYS